jgi:hypothetical protein
MFFGGLRKNPEPPLGNLCNLGQLGFPSYSKSRESRGMADVQKLIQYPGLNRLGGLGSLGCQGSG